MSSIVKFLTSALVLVAATVPAPGFNITASLSAALANSVEACRTHSLLNPLKGADFAISTFDRSTVETFSRAWRRAGNGSLPNESVVLILRVSGGVFRANDLGSTNEYKKFTFRWHPATIAIVHTHPNTSDPKPQADDIEIADKHLVPIFTITSRGMYVYDPGIRKISKVMSNLDWLDVSRWSRGALARQ